MDNPDDFDPLALFAGLASGGARIQAVFLGPPPPALGGQVNQYLADGTGPLQALEAGFAQQGSSDPAGDLRRMLGAAKGVCVVVIARDHGVVALPQLWFGQPLAVEAPRLVAGCAGQAGDPAELTQLIAAVPDRPWPLAFATLDGVPGDIVSLREGWLAVAAGVVQASQSVLAGFAEEPAARERLADLAWWAAEALSVIEPGEDAALQAELEIRCRLMTGDVVSAGAGLDRLVASGGGDDLAEPLNAFVDSVRRTSRVDEAARWLAGRLPDWDAALGAPYETAQALFRLQVAAQRPTEEWLATAALMAKRDRKAMRQDLTREPIWEITVPSGILLEPAQAAILAERSTVAMVKRMESGTLPWSKVEDRIRIPETALRSWLAVLAAQGLAP